MRFLHIINRDFNQIYCFLLPAVFLCFPYILAVSQHSLVSSYIHYAMPPMPLRKKRKSQQKNTIILVFQTVKIFHPLFQLMSINQ